MRILVVEDNEKVAQLTVRRLAEAGFVVDRVATVEEARAALGVAAYDLILLDLTLPDGDGTQILRTLRAKGEAVPVLIVTARDDVAHRVEALNEGADDYIVKPFSAEELLARVRAVLRRPLQTVGPVLELGNVSLDTASLSLHVGGEPTSLPRREFDVLAALLRHRGRILSRERLEAAVYSLDDEVSPNALEATISRLRRRLGMSGATICITAMRGLGYVLAESPPG